MLRVRLLIGFEGKFLKGVVKIGLRDRGASRRGTIELELKSLPLGRKGVKFSSC